jgi:hypothetical protein
VSFGATVIAPAASIDTPRESPRKTSARELTDQMPGSEAEERVLNSRIKKTENRSFFIGCDLRALLTDV